MDITLAIGATTIAVTETASGNPLWSISTSAIEAIVPHDIVINYDSGGPRDDFHGVSFRAGGTQFTLDIRDIQAGVPYPTSQDLYDAILAVM